MKDDGKKATKKKAYDQPAIIHVEKLQPGAVTRPEGDDPTCDGGSVRGGRKPEASEP